VPPAINTRHLSSVDLRWSVEVDGLVRIPGLTQAAPYKSHPQPPNCVLRSLTSDPPKHEHSKQSRALSTNTQGTQGERKGEGATHEQFGSSKKQPSANKSDPWRSARSGLSSTTEARHLAPTLVGGKGAAP